MTLVPTVCGLCGESYEQERRADGSRSLHDAAVCRLMQRHPSRRWRDFPSDDLEEQVRDGERAHDRAEAWER